MSVADQSLEEATREPGINDDERSVDARAGTCGPDVCDPCCGAGTALVAAIRCGLVNPKHARRAVGGDISEEHVNLAATWIQAPTLETPRGQRVHERQLALRSL